MRKRVYFSPLAVGANSLLTIYAVLCLMILALLSLNTVLAQKRLADASVQAVEEYYQADCQAERILAKLRNGEKVSGVECDGDIYKYECAISENQNLMVEVRLHQTGWEVLRWQAVLIE